MTTLPSSEGDVVPSPVPAPAIVGDATLYHADCRDVLRGLPDNSIDSVVTDPPYALVSIQKRFGKPGSAPAKDVYGRGAAGFMGKQWDTGEVAFSEDFWAECLRVLKPGGHVVAFSGTRTYHRMAVAIEDAGFEIRDQLGWVYGSGFAKSHAVDLGLWKGVLNCQSKDNAPLVVQLSAFTLLKSSEGKELIVAAPALILPEGKPALIIRTGTAEDTFGLTVMSLSESEQTTISLSTEWSWERSLVENSDPRSMYTTETNSRQITTQEIWKSLTSLTMRKSTPQDATLKNGWTWPAVAVASNSSVADTNKSAIPILTALEGATWNPVAQAKGIGSGLKPAWEPICLARKPLVGTVAENVLAHGVGALNIDGCRVEARGRPLIESKSEASVNTFGSGLNGSRSVGSTDLGRWPANICHDGSPEVLAAFPVTGASSGAPRNNNTSLGSSGANVFGKGGAFVGAGHADAGGSAARFFYCAKASRKDRDEGLEHLPKQVAAAMQGNLTPGQRLAGNGTPIATPKRANTHPTVKPTDLMRWLCRLVTPPGGTILDPFMGSGSTGKGAILEGFEFIGIEREDEYMPIAEARIAAALRRADNAP